MTSRLFLNGPYFPEHDDNLMKSEGDVVAARADFFDANPNNLRCLLEGRYGRMNKYLEGCETVFELGSGAGFASEFIDNPNLKMTDVVARPWIDAEVDALDLPWDDNSLDAIVCSHMIHHLASPTKFFNLLSRKLKPGGKVVIQEINTSLLMRLMLRLMRHEGWSYDVDVFDADCVANNPNDPWSANCAIPEMLFDDIGEFERRVAGFKVVHHELWECFIFLISGGVIAKTATIQMPWPVLRAISGLDRLLTGLFPSLFALGRFVVLEKTD
ncbi:MAG: class I SAM-dependent methyltransferase [Alphaproteobacteria bacterium]